MQVNSSLNPVFYHCFDSRTAVFIFTAYTVTKILLCGFLSIFVFYLGHQRWRQKRSIKTTNHSDIFTYHAAAIELNSVAAYIFHFSGTYYDIPMMEKLGLYFSNMTYAGEMLFHWLTCAERYLAVVHPIIYRGLKQSRGVKIRNMDEKRVDQSKQRAFHTVMAISAVLWLWFVGILLCISVDVSSFLSYNDGCVVMMSGLWFTLPGSLVLPLLCLHSAGKLLCCQYRNE